MAAGLAIINKNADYGDNPMGFVNINPPPELPADLHTLLLPRRNLFLTQQNRIDGEAVAVGERFGQGGQITYTTNSVATTKRKTGFLAPWAIPYDTGFTLFAVFKMPKPMPATESTLSAGDWNSALQSGFRLLIESNRTCTWTVVLPDGSARALVSLGAVPYVNGTEQPTDWLMAAVAFDPSAGDHGAVRLRYPSANREISADLAAYGGSPCDPDAGLAILLDVNPGANDEPSSVSVAMVGICDKVLTPGAGGEIDQVYTALKPWLLARGVEIL